MMQITYPTNAPQPIALPARLCAWNWQFDRRQYESAEARSLLSSNGLDDMDSLFALADGCVHRHKQRAVSRVVLPQPQGLPVEAFIKMNWGTRRLIPRATDVRTGQALQSLPLREWKGIATLRSLGLFVPERLAHFKRGWLRYQEAVIVKRVPPRFSLNEMIRQGKWAQLSQDDQRALLECLVEVMQRIHQSGLGWRGTCSRHFFPERTDQGHWQCWLIDCEGVHRHVTRRDIARDYRKLHRGLMISGLKAASMNLFQKLSESAQRSHARERSSRFLRSFSYRLDPTLKPSA